MSFMNPLLLFATLGIALPIMAHLLNRYQVKQTDWAAMQFLNRSVRVRSRQLRLRDLLLLMLRCLAVLLLAFALARPATNSADGIWLPGEERAGVVIALDAPDSVLWERVTTRDRSHEALDRGRSAWSAFAESYRRSFATVLAAMERPDGPQILRYDTSRMSTDEIARHVAESVGAVWSHGERSLGAADDGGDAG